MIHTQVNETIADLLEVYRVKVSNLEEGLDHTESALSTVRNNLERAEKDRDRYREDADRNHKLVQGRAKTNVELAEKIKKLEGVIESLHIELQTEREAHQATKENQA